MPPHPETSPPRRHSFILSLWPQADASPDQPAWRISLEDAQTAQRRGFGNLAELAAFLEAWTCNPPGGEPPLSQPEDVDPT